MWYVPTAYEMREASGENTESKSHKNRAVEEMREQITQTRYFISYSATRRMQIVNDARRYDDMHSLRAEGFIQELRKAA